MAVSRPADQSQTDRHRRNHRTDRALDADDATETALEGEYKLIDANLSTINGIGGTLQSQGRYLGLLTAIDVIGKTTTPDFSLDLGGSPMPLATSFHARVDGTDGSTRLMRVDAKLDSTPIVASGLIDNTDGPGRRAVTIDSEIKRRTHRGLPALPSILRSHCSKATSARRAR